MKKEGMRKALLLFCFLISGIASNAQGIHFSQFYNAPQLVNPANTALMPDQDFRIGAQYREQWSNVPAAFKTTSAYADFQLMRNRNITNWMGVGVGFFSDRAGAGILALNKLQLALAYHVQMGETQMLSVGLGGAYVHRSIDFSRLTFDAQWDGFSFNSNMAQNEPFLREQVSYLDLMAGINYAYFPNPNYYLKIGLSAQHLNRPSESFYKEDNKLGIRPILNAEGLFMANERWIINPSLYYSYQKKAEEAIFGSLFNYNLTGSDDKGNQLIMGAFYRWGESFIPVIGIEWSNINVTVSYDATVSAFSQANRNFGAIEISLSYKSLYSSMSSGRNRYYCPRF